MLVASVYLQTSVSFDYDISAVILLLRNQSGINLMIAIVIMTTVLIFGYQTILTYRFIDTSADVHEAGTEVVQEFNVRVCNYIYRHLYRLQVYLLEPIFTGYILSQLF